MFLFDKIDVFVKNSLELIKNSESVIEKIVNTKKSNDSGNNHKDEEKEEQGARNADSADSGEEGSSSDEVSIESPLTSKNQATTSKASTKNNKKSKKLKTKLGKTIKNVIIHENIYNYFNKNKKLNTIDFEFEIKKAMHLRELKKIQKFNEKVNKSFQRVEEIL